MQEILEDFKSESIRNLISSGRRPDGREFEEVRPFSFERNVISTAEGSCLIHLGDTQILVAVKTATGEPYADSPNSGVLITSAELVPTAAPEVESGPPTANEKYVEIARVVDRTIRESEMIEMEKLAIEPGKLVRILFLDIHILDDGGNLIDGATMAGVLALRSAEIKKVLYEDGKVTVLDELEQLPVKAFPLACSIAKFGNSLLVDPTYEEEVAMDSKIVFGIDEEEHIRAMQKSGSGPWQREQIEQAMELAQRTVKDLRQKLVAGEAHEEED